MNTKNTQEKRSYEDITTDLKNVLNLKGRSSGNKSEKVHKLLRELEIKHEIVLSKQFLKTLYSGLSNSSKNQRVNKLLKEMSHAEPQNQNRYFKELNYKKFKTSVTNWSTANTTNRTQALSVGIVESAYKKKCFNMLITEPEKVLELRHRQQELLNQDLEYNNALRIQNFFNLN